jgi:hypothetical protein
VARYCFLLGSILWITFGRNLRTKL